MRLEGEGISQSYMELWVYSALNFRTGPTGVKDYFKVGATSLKSGSEKNIVRIIYQSAIMKGTAH